MPPPELTDFIIRQHGSVAVLAYNRPQSGNSMHYNVLKSLHEAVKWATSNFEINVIVQTGTGKFFNTGLDMGDNGEKVLLDKIHILREVMILLIKCNKVLIAAVNGPGVGYGATSLGIFDLVYSVPHAYFFTPFAKWAVIPEGCSSFTFPSILGHQKAMSLLLAGETISAEELHTAGLISKIIPAKTHDEFMTKVLEVAQRIASYPPQALATTKILSEGGRVKELLATNEKEYERWMVTFKSTEFKEAILNFSKEQKEKKARAEKHKHQGPKL